MQNKFRSFFPFLPYIPLLGKLAVAVGLQKLFTEALHSNPGDLPNIGTSCELGEVPFSLVPEDKIYRGHVIP